MNILIIETATEACSVALQINGQVYSHFEVCPQQHSQRILPMIDEVLKQANIELNDVEYLGFGRGPGSFTGVRIATGIIQGLALGTGHKVIGVSTLAAMAQEASERFQAKEVYAAIDARMSEVYFAHYHNNRGVMSLVDAEQVLPPEEAQALITVNQQAAGVGTGWQAYESLHPEQTLKILEPILYPNAKYMLSLAEKAITDGLAIDVDDIQPVYLRDKVTWKKLPGRE